MIEIIKLIMEQNSSFFTGFGVVIVLDILTGLLKALKKKNINSTIFRDGIIKKAGEVVVVVLAVMLDYMTGMENAFTLISLSFLVLSEGTSIVENLGEIGVPIPNAILEYFAKLNGKIDIEDK